MNSFRRADRADTERLLDSASARVDATLDQGPSVMPTEVDANSPGVHLSAPNVPPAEPVAALLAAASN
ncbi:hypothetical protein, partial [Micromonospora noduli]|uniref:hypothetical protein n=1 Tax=Micromonospora noduli TaxID=709876 RepID=UPI0011BF9F66